MKVNHSEIQITKTDIKNLQVMIMDKDSVILPIHGHTVRPALWWIDIEALIEREPRKPIAKAEEVKA